MGRVILNAENITKTYSNRRGKNVVLDGFSLQIEEGKFYAVVGESGSGKSTLLSILSGLQKPDSGRVIYGPEGIQGEIPEESSKGISKEISEEDSILSKYVISDMNDDELTKLRRHDIVYAPQSQEVLPTLNVEYNIRLVDNFDKNEKAEDELTKITRLSLILEELGISDLIEEYPSALSGGELRRLCIARTLYAEPKVILADEPTNDLDKDNREILRKIFRSIADRGVSVVTVTHDEELAKVADEIISL